MIYKNAKDEIVIFGNYFTKINKKCRIYINNKQYNLTYKIKKENNKNLLH